MSAWQLKLSARWQTVPLDAGMHPLQHTWLLSLQVAPGNSLQVFALQHWSAPVLMPKPGSHCSPSPNKPSPQNSCVVSSGGQQWSTNGVGTFATFGYLGNNCV